MNHTAAGSTFGAFQWESNVFTLPLVTTCTAEGAGRFAPEAWGHLLALSGSGAINPAELEHIIERALIQFEGRIALDDLRSLMEGPGYAEGPPAPDNQTVH